MRTSTLLSAEEFARVAEVARVEGFLELPPELIIEVLSDDESFAEMEQKIAEYHAAGVDLVWVLDHRALALRAYPRDALPVLLRDTDTASADPHVPGFSCRVSELFED